MLRTKAEMHAVRSQCMNYVKRLLNLICCVGKRLLFVYAKISGVKISLYLSFKNPVNTAPTWHKRTELMCCSEETLYIFQ